MRSQPPPHSLHRVARSRKRSSISDYRASRSKRLAYVARISLVTSSASTRKPQRRPTSLPRSLMPRSVVLKGLHLDQVSRYERYRANSSDEDEETLREDLNENAEKDLAVPLNVEFTGKFNNKKVVASLAWDSAWKNSARNPSVRHLKQRTGDHHQNHHTTHQQAQQTEHHSGSQTHHQRRQCQQQHRPPAYTKIASHFIHSRRQGPIIQESSTPRNLTKTSIVDAQSAFPSNNPIEYSSHSPNQRQRHPRLNGADLYVARFRVKVLDSNEAQTNPTAATIPSTCFDLVLPAQKNPATTPCAPLSLHDELVNPHPKATNKPQPTSLRDSATTETAPRASKPCYRCIAYMHCVGIKRVFWTNHRGEWENAKVKDLIDVLEGTKSSEGEVYATKHDVLAMMQRLMTGA